MQVFWINQTFFLKSLYIRCVREGGRACVKTIFGQTILQRGHQNIQQYLTFHTFRFSCNFSPVCLSVYLFLLRVDVKTIYGLDPQYSLFFIALCLEMRGKDKCLAHLFSIWGQILLLISQ